MPAMRAGLEKSNFLKFLIFIKQNLLHKPELCEVQLNNIHNETYIFSIGNPLDEFDSYGKRN
ncbi:hypothetical protein HMPREF0765_0411 [Sphingobacterium spiritivorum ATCC 33300]|uniref:Uncharacterized protein n=1 Tax=Sphingobacterium spiritivorum ATCC 33300 TaxID=525372 RepID=C2FSV5_SPHSI|nr:hypothetical protein HMPREF0765_0411 [Sphingobacterium spiritivorum ATCC 33300]